MYLREIYIDDISDRMKLILEAHGEAGLQKLDPDDPARRMYLKIRQANMEKEKEEHKKVIDYIRRGKK